MQASSEFHASGKRDGDFLLALSVMCLSALAIGSILLSWFVGGMDYVNSFYGTYAMGVLAVVFVVSAYFYGRAKKQSG
jgi:hypothetical protein